MDLYIMDTLLLQTFLWSRPSFCYTYYYSYYYDTLQWTRTQLQQTFASYRPVFESCHCRQYWNNKLVAVMTTPMRIYVMMMAVSPIARCLNGCCRIVVT